MSETTLIELSDQPYNAPRSPDPLPLFCSRCSLIMKHDSPTIIIYSADAQLIFRYHLTCLALPAGETHPVSSTPAEP